ncbi:hypothetical protein OIU84_015846 [Salix udensis]|uniref:PGG domain-containing protein n=1 Tax=Salix udensis TaxID=889485 RepID=A0AAD6J8J6_9ROSI|nr:hypothetical protein OIU84_015846 [Salix udensis]
MSEPTKAKLERNVSWFKRFQYNERIDKPKDARNVLLIVVALIAAVTFQAGVNPPGGVWQGRRSSRSSSLCISKGCFLCFPDIKHFGSLLLYTCHHISHLQVPFPF